MKPSTTITKHPQALSNPSMVFSTGLRFTASSVLLHKLSFPLAPNRFTRLCNGFSDTHFLFDVPPSRSRTTLQSMKARRKEETTATNAIKGDGEGNNSVPILKEMTLTEGRVMRTELHKEATEAYMAYAMSVLLGRALPDVRDGLKQGFCEILGRRSK